MAKVIVYEYKVNGLSKLIKNQDDLTKAIKESKTEFNKSDFGTTKYNAANRQLAELNNTQASVRKENKLLQQQMIVTADKGRNSANALTAQLKILEAQYLALGKAERQAASGKELSNRISSLRTEIKAIKSDLGQNGLSGAFKDAFLQIGGGALAAGGLTRAISELKQFVGESITLFADFNRQISFLGAVSNASAEDLEKLKNLSRELGETTQYTASQVAQLEIEYAKLGFKPAEILAATKATLDLATVAQSDLGETATVVGATIRAYNFDASESTRVTDVLAKSFSSSALDLRKFETAFAQVGPVAATANVPFEQTVALMGILADRGVDASTVGSGLRNVFLDLAKEGLTLTEALEQINNAEDKNVAALELFGKRGATIGAILAGTQEQVKGLTVTLEESAGFADQAGKKIAGDFKGSFEVLTSTIEGFKLNLIDLFDGAIKSFIGFLVTIISNLSSFLILLQQLPKFLQDNKTEIIGLSIAIVGLNSAAIAANATILITNARTLAMAAAQRGAAIATNILTIAQRGLNTAMKANPIGLIITGVGLLITLFSSLIKRSDTAKGTFEGLKAVAKELFKIVSEAFRAFSDSFTAFKEGRIKDGFKALGQGLIKSNPIGIAFQEGKRLGNAFNNGYNNALTANDEAETAQSKLNTSVDEGEKLQSALNDTIDDGADSTDNYTKKLEAAAVATDNFAIGSVAQLRKELRDLNEELDKAAPADQQGLLTKIIDAEKALDEVELFQKQLRERILGTGTIGIVDPIAKLQIESTRKASDEIIEEVRRRNKVIESENLNLGEVLKELQDDIFNGISEATRLTAEASQQSSDSQIRNLEDRYNREIELSAGNNRRQEALRQELADRTAEIERKEFEQQKKYRVAAALTSLAEGIINTLSAPTTIPDPFGTAFKAFRIGILSTTALKQISNINKQTASRGTLIRQLADGDIINGVARGATHGNGRGGIPISINGQRLLIEHGEFLDNDEFGSTAVVNKRSSSAFNEQLQSTRGLTFPGKRKYLSDINNYRNWGIKYAQAGAISEPSLSSISRAVTTTSSSSGLSASAVVTAESAKMIAESTAIAVEKVLTDIDRQRERRGRLAERTGI